MKKSLFILGISIFSAFGSSAQCVADTAGLATKNVAPDSLSCVVVGQSFSGTISIKIPTTITSSGVTVTVDSVSFSGITGFPTGITSVSNPSYGTWLKPGDYACAAVSGTTSSNAGRYNLNITGTACGHGTVAGQPVSQCINNFPFAQVYPYHLTVCNPAGVSEISADMAMSIYPNPNKGSFTVTISAPERMVGEMTIVDALGRKVQSTNIDVTGIQQLPLTLRNAAAGVYTLMINAGGKQAIKQFIVQ